jgi:hypothetical protein
LRRDTDGRLAIAFRIEFFGQYPCPLTRYGQRRFAELARLYGVAKANECRPGGSSRAIELTPEFIADLLDSPTMTHDAENADAPARENDDSASCSEENPCYETT